MMHREGAIDKRSDGSDSSDKAVDALYIQRLRSKVGYLLNTSVNREIQLHDSEISEVSHTSGSTKIVFSTAYVHETAGVPGADPGCIWTQVAVITIGDANLPVISEGLPIWVMGGTLAIAKIRHEEFIPSDGHFEGDINLELHLSTADGSDGGTLLVKGSRVQIELCGDPSASEDYTACNRRDV